MRDKTHMEQVERWARYVKTNPRWRDFHDDFINAQYEMAEDFIRRLAEQPGGREKIIKIYGIKNTKGYPRLLGKQFTDLKPQKWGKGTEHISDQVDEILYGD